MKTILCTCLFAGIAFGQEILVHGHRGARALRPENTLAAFKYAIDNGVDVLEMDLAVTKDNVLVVSHHPAIATDKPSYPGERVCIGPHDGMPIRMQTLAEVKQYDCGTKTLKEFPKQVAVPGEKIPTFEEVLELALPTKVELNVETKIFPNHPELTPSPEEFVKLINAAVVKRHMESRVILQSFDFRTLVAMKKLNPAIRRAALFGVPQGDAAMGLSDPDKGFVSVARKSQATLLSPAHQLVTPAEVKPAHAAGFPVVPWTANTPEDWKRLMDANVDAIISDDPKALLEWLRAQHRHR